MANSDINGNLHLGRAELLSRIAALEAEVARKDAAIRRALDEAVADDMDGWYAGLRAALADQPAEGEK